MLTVKPIDYNPFENGKEIEKIIFTNEPQREIWLACIIGAADANRAYNESFSLKLLGDLNVAAFTQATSTLIKRHEALRATISTNGEYLIVYKEMLVPMVVEDLTSLSIVERNEAFSSFLKSNANMVLSINEGPLLQMHLHKTGNDEHYFTLLIHHIIGDGWSIGVILEEISKLYNASTTASSVELDPPFQITDYASVEASFKQSKQYQETLSYWQQQFADMVPMVELPTDRQRLPQRTFNGHRIDQTISLTQLNAIKEVGAQGGASLVVTLLAAFEILLYKMTQQQDLVVGLPAAGQSVTSLPDVVGHCVNLLPLRSKVEPGLSFLSYLKKRKVEFLTALEHQQLTFSELLKKLYIPRDASRVALVPVMLNIDLGMDQKVAFNDLEFELISNPRAFENFELYLNIADAKQGMVLEWSYNTDLFDSTTILQIHQELIHLLDKISHSPSCLISELTKEEVKNISCGHGANFTIPSNLTVLSLIETTASRRSDAIAISYEQHTISYAELQERVNRLAAFLMNKNVQVGDVVAVSIERSIDMVVCLLAIFKTGAAYLPIDPQYPFDRKKYMLEDSKAKLLLTSRKYSLKTSVHCEVLIIENVWSNLPQEQQPCPFPKLVGDNLAYLLYTSGSTGNPKGVKVSHRNLVNFLLSMQATPGITAYDKLLAITSISFDIAGLELYLPLISGAELILASTEATRDGRLLLDIIEQKQISILQATPTSWQLLLDAGWSQPLPLKALCGGEPLSASLALQLLGLCNELWNMYGPTETTIWSSIKRIVQNEEQITIGKPIHNTQWCIMDDEGKPVEKKKVGEIYIGGAGVAEGYWNQEELTTEKFISLQQGQGMRGTFYKTGDLGKMLDNGELVCLGRKDHQVKLRGHRIELGEIETCLSALDSIKQSVVIIREDIPGNKQLVGYVTLKDIQEKSVHKDWESQWENLYKKGKEQVSHEQQHDLDAALLQVVTHDDVSKQHVEWLQLTIERIQAIGAKNIFEVGCGSGQLLFALAPFTNHYIATDFAPTAIQSIQNRINEAPTQWQQITAYTAAADDFSPIYDKPIDLVLINSVAQYFPTIDYTLHVLKQAIHALEKGGCVFVGDMQGKNTLSLFHTIDYLVKANPITTISTLQEVVDHRIQIEDELVADPSFFYLLPTIFPEITGVDVQLRRGYLINETTKYHFDVWLFVNTTIEMAHPEHTIQWDSTRSLTSIEELLVTATYAVLEVKNIPNARTYNDIKIKQQLENAPPDSILAGLQHDYQLPSTGEQPDSFWELAERHQYRAHVRWATDGTDGFFEVVFIKSTNKHLIPATPIPITQIALHQTIRAPHTKNEVLIETDVLVTWKQHLAKSLPSYMIPDEIIGLKQLPLTPNAKIDRKALPKPKRRKTVNTEQRILLPIEQKIAAIWSEVLSVEIITPTDDFFQLGGHSLLAVKVMARLEKITGKRLTIATLFENSTIEKLARVLSLDTKVISNANDWNVLVPMKANGNKMPLFFVHGADLNVILFKSVSTYLDADQPVFGLQALGINHETNIPLSIEQMASKYIEDMLQAQPESKYAIAGYSLGGFIAFEIAKQLQEMGKEVAFLGIIDTFAGNNFEGSAINKIMHQGKKMVFLLDALITKPRKALQYQRQVLEQKIRNIFEKDGDLPIGKFTNYEAEIYKKYSIALDAYQLTSAELKVTLFTVNERQYYLQDPETMGWRKFALRGVRRVQVPGDHSSVLYPPHDKSLAKAIQLELNKIIDSNTH